MIAAKNDACKRKFDCRGASIRADIGGRGIRRWPTWAALSLHGLAPPVALDIHLEDCRVMDEAIDRGEGHFGIAEHGSVPLFLNGSCLTSRSLTRIISYLGTGLRC